MSRHCLHTRLSDKAMCVRHACDSNPRSLSLVTKLLWPTRRVLNVVFGFCLTIGKLVLESAGLSRPLRGGANCYRAGMGGEATLSDIWNCRVRDCWAVVSSHCLLPRYVCSLSCFFACAVELWAFQRYEASRVSKKATEADSTTVSNPV